MLSRLEPLIPYLELPELEVLPVDSLAPGWPPISLTVKPFGTLVALAVCLGCWLVWRQGRRLGFAPESVSSYLLHVLIGGFLGGHTFYLIAYAPGAAHAQPESWLRLWEGQSSFGGFLGALVGLLVFGWRHRTPVLPYADLMASSFPASWALGRAGCSLVHDHPGLRSDVWFAVRYPLGARLDLGLLELVVMLPLAAVFWRCRQRPQPWGLFCGVLLLAYAPTRFALDLLRAHELPGRLGWPDPRYLSLTAAQWCCIPALMLGMLLLPRALGRAGTPEALRPPPGRRVGPRGQLGLPG